MVSAPVSPGAPATAARPRWFILRPLPASHRPTPGGLRLGPELRSLTVWPSSGLGEDGREAPPGWPGSTAAPRRQLLNGVCLPGVLPELNDQGRTHAQPYADHHLAFLRRD